MYIVHLAFKTGNYVVLSAFGEALAKVLNESSDVKIYWAIIILLLIGLHFVNSERKKYYKDLQNSKIQYRDSKLMNAKSEQSNNEDLVDTKRADQKDK